MKKCDKCSGTGWLEDSVTDKINQRLEKIALLLESLVKNTEIKEADKKLEAINYNNHKLIRMKELSKILKVSPGTIYRLIKQSDFPNPVYIGAQSRGWKESDIDLWISSRKKKTEVVKNYDDRFEKEILSFLKDKKTGVLLSEIDQLIFNNQLPTDTIKKTLNKLVLEGKLRKELEPIWPERGKLKPNRSRWYIIE